MLLFAFQNVHTDLILTRSDIKLFPTSISTSTENKKKKALEIIAQINEHV